MRKIIKILLIGLFLPIFSQAQPKHEIRAVWLTSLYSLDWPYTKATNKQSLLKQKEELCHILDQLQKANINTILFQTRLRGDVIYPSTIETFDECLTGKPGGNPGYDPLLFAIEECHKRNMEIHAWVVAIPLGKTKQIRSLGNKSVVRKHPDLCKSYQGNWYLDPGNPKTKQYLSRLTMEIVNNYDIDGIHLDYIRYPERSHRFPDQSTYRIYGNGKEKSQWRRDNITAIVRSIYQEVKSRKPWVKVSCSPVGKFSDTRRFSSKGWNALNTVHQDAQLWMKEGIIDILFPMMYFRNNDFFPFALDWNENKEKRFLVPGLGIYFLDAREGNWQLGDIMKQIYFIRQFHLDGQAYFRNKFFTDNTKNIFDATTEHFYSLPAFVPPMTWNDSIPPSAPTACSLTETNGRQTLKWNTSTNNDSTEIKYRIYASNNYPVNIDNPENIVNTGTADTLFTIYRTDRNGTRLYWSVTAVDRYGNESTASEFNAPLHSWDNIFSADNLTLYAGTTLIVSTVAGQEILRISNDEQEKMQQLPHGFYRISLIDNKGHRTDKGLMLR